jgi:hypothetical protein
MVLAGVRITTTNVDVTFLRVQLLERYRYHTTADTIDEVTKTLALPLELLRLRVQLSTTMPTVATITPASATEGN